MRSRVFFAAIGLLLSQTVPGLASASAGRTPGKRSLLPRGIKSHDHPNPDLVSNGTFDQLLDHSDPGKGTFKQRYWWDAKSWAGPGSPVFVLNVGEQNADGFQGYLDNGTVPGLYADTFNGAVIVIEHRYWGESIPFDTLTAETLQYLDVPQSVMDMTYFAKTVPLEFDDSNGGANAPNAPWVLIGGSYPGALAAWTQQLDPGTFWAYHATSAVVEAIYDFYPYYDAVTAAIPQNCSNDVKAVIKYVDWIFANGTQADQTKLKELFGLGMLDHADDFAQQLTTPLAAWQESEEQVFQFCDYIENSAASSGKVVQGHGAGVGLDTALVAYAEYIAKNVAPGCASGGCNTYNTSTVWNTPDVLDGDRQWIWLLCHNPFAWWQVGPPAADGQHVVSSYLRPEHDQRQCAAAFPETNGFQCGSVEGFTTEHLNYYTGGWDADFERVLFVNGEFDPWYPATVQSSYRNGGPRQSTDKMPIVEIPGGNHCPDLVISSQNEKYVQQELEIMGKWLSEWTKPSKQ
ncbi:peptidase S28 [Diplogelasinospora grovesii]|uniref:Peptidase S28 n=1 Tax=Diplogelasinospora grovesii TaxID=303347 RepID=A0AAN6S190_9PEZI|nr:peptidase S28 [Diplogelasinospora grovesii]